MLATIVVSSFLFVNRENYSVYVGFPPSKEVLLLYAPVNLHKRVHTGRRVVGGFYSSAAGHWNGQLYYFWVIRESCTSVAPFQIGFMLRVVKYVGQLVT